jgi:[acyl-carrier-protein] S-malonyltransferase
MSIAFTFPGQGSQTVGMGQALTQSYPEARAVFEEVDEALGEKLSTVIWDGPPEHLTLTANAQPALMAVSLAVVRVLHARGFEVSTSAAFVAGHSLGEYSALAAAGSLSLADTARLLRVRGAAMQRAVPVGEGAMAAVLGLDLQAVKEVALEAAGGAVCEVANDNADGQVVVSGAGDAVDRAIELSRQKGAKRAIKLPVSAPFHCALMAPAAQAVADALEQVNLRAPVVPVVCNVSASAVTDADQIRRNLVDQVTGTVRWRESVLWMAANGVTELIELGAGRVLSGLARRIDKSLSGKAVGGPQDIDALLASHDKIHFINSRD